MFRDDAQTSAVIAALWWRSYALRELWTEAGPTPDADHFYEHPEERPGWSSSECVLWDLGWALWNTANHCELGALLSTLDGDNLAAVGNLLVALGMGSDAVDRWLDAQRVLREQRSRGASGAVLELAR